MSLPYIVKYALRRIVVSLFYYLNCDYLYESINSSRTFSKFFKKNFHLFSNQSLRSGTTKSGEIEKEGTAIFLLVI